MVMVGDTVSDMEMANRAGTALAVGLTGGADTQEALNQAADVLVQSIEELLPQASS
jgi:phosphoglycolate phosphatase-like HAD superfamily hydrolase